MAGWAAWSPVRERDKLGVVTYNYQVVTCLVHWSAGARNTLSDPIHSCSPTIKKICDSQVQQDLHLQAFIGDKVHIFEETDHWYLACLARNTGIRGIIPKVYFVILPY